MCDRERWREITILGGLTVFGGVPWETSCISSVTPHPAQRSVYSHLLLMMTIQSTEKSRSSCKFLLSAEPKPGSSSPAPAEPSCDHHALEQQERKRTTGDVGGHGRGPQTS